MYVFKFNSNPCRHLDLSRLTSFITHVIVVISKLRFFISDIWPKYKRISIVLFHCCCCFWFVYVVGFCTFRVTDCRPTAQKDRILRLRTQDKCKLMATYKYQDTTRISQAAWSRERNVNKAWVNYPPFESVWRQHSIQTIRQNWPDIPGDQTTDIPGDQTKLTKLDS